MFAMLTLAFHNMFMTFSSRPKMEKLHGATLFDKVRNMGHADWGMNTDLDAVFRCVLNTAVNNNIASEELPKAIVIISDMQIDSCLRCSKDFHEHAKKMFAEHGYTLPNVIFWNVNSTSDTYHADANRPGVQYLSGHSTSAFKSLLDGINKNPIDAMLETILSDRYAAITVA